MFCTTPVLSLRHCISPNFLLSESSSKYDNRKTCGVYLKLKTKLLRSPTPSPSRHFNELRITNARCSSTSQGPISDDSFHQINQDIDVSMKSSTLYTLFFIWNGVIECISYTVEESARGRVLEEMEGKSIMSSLTTMFLLPLPMVLKLSENATLG